MVPEPQKGSTSGPWPCQPAPAVQRLARRVDAHRHLVAYQAHEDPQPAVRAGGAVVAGLGGARGDAADDAEEALGHRARVPQAGAVARDPGQDRGVVGDPWRPVDLAQLALERGEGEGLEAGDAHDDPRGRPQPEVRGVHLAGRHGRAHPAPAPPPAHAEALKLGLQERLQARYAHGERVEPPPAVPSVLPGHAAMVVESGAHWLMRRHPDPF
jgi:hypothetical protein